MTRAEAAFYHLPADLDTEDCFDEPRTQSEAQQDTPSLPKFSWLKVFMVCVLLYSGYELLSPFLAWWLGNNWK
jgi:hypothetical protein